MRFQALATPEQRLWRCSWCDPEIPPGHPGDRNATDPELRLPDNRKRRDRNCDGSGKKLGIAWQPDLCRCPKRYVFNPDVAAVLDWWADWRMGLGLPYGSVQALDEPGFVYESIRICQIVFNKAQSEVTHGK